MLTETAGGGRRLVALLTDSCHAGLRVREPVPYHTGVMTNLSIYSETTRLRSVMLHRPGPEIEHMTPELRDELLFDEILWLPGARMEHDIFAATIRALAGPESVLYVEDLLEDVLAEEQPRRALVEEVMALEPGYKSDKESLAAELLELEPSRLATALVAGQQEDTPHSLAEFLEDRTLYRPQPVPNLLFMRDPSAVVDDRVVVSSMKHQARRREPLLLRYIFARHPRFASADGTSNVWWDPFLAHEGSYPNAHVEGGDVLVLNDHALLVGCSERTDHQGIDALARCLLQEGAPIRTVYVALLPPRRAWMHLDTVFTLLSEEECVAYPPLLRGHGNEGIRLLEMSLTKKGVRVREHTAFLPDLLNRQEGMRLQAISCGGTEPLLQDREQWTDGANFFALAPGVVLGYERNEETYELLQGNAGYEVLSVEGHRTSLGTGEELCVDGEWISDEALARRVGIGSGRKVALKVPSSELSRGRGGPRCMTMPLVRDPA